MSQNPLFRKPDLTALPPASGPFSAQMLAQLLTLHEDMIAQLCVERAEAVTNANFISSMIDQHESAATMLRAHLEYLSTLPQPVASMAMPLGVLAGLRPS